MKQNNDKTGPFHKRINLVRALTLWHTLMFTNLKH